MTPSPDLAAGLVCPIPLSTSPRVLLGHGGGGTLMRDLVERVFLPAFGNDILNERGDGAVLPTWSSSRPLAFSTDTYVVHPLFFPGGDIGALAVYGTVNDLAVSGARPLYLSAGFILEEGLPMETLRRIVESMRLAAAEAGVLIVTGDTKVVERGRGDGVFINTTGIGVLAHDDTRGPQAIRAGDAVVVNGDIARHGMAVLAVREGLSFEGTISSDLAPLAGMVGDLLEARIEVHCMRDLTRGGLASALNEIASRAGLRIEIEEDLVPVREDVRAGCEVLGIDPFQVACEGRLVAFVPGPLSPRAVEVMSRWPCGVGARVIGEVTAKEADPSRALVAVRTAFGATRVLDTLSGEQLPRIC